MDAIVIGGGIAGTVTAMALRRAGMDATVHEAYDRSADGVGAFLTLAVNGMAALRVLDLDDVTRAGFATPRMVMRGSAGQRLATFANGPTLADGTVSRTVRRADLYAALRDEAVRRGVQIRYGARLVDAEKDGDRVVASFSDGSTATGDVLVGADGLRSRTRTIIDPAAPAPRYLGLLDTGGFARGVAVDSEPGVMEMTFGRRCFFAFVRTPDDEVWWFANVPRRQRPTTEELAALSGETWRDELVALLDDDPGPAADLVRRSHRVVPPWPTCDLPSVPTWHDERAVVIGDAAHAASPASGQGASLAVEDAVTLGRCLRDAPDVATALAAYERLRRPRVERVVAQGQRNGQAKAVGPAARVVRDLILRLVLPRVARRAPQRQAWLYDHRIDWDEPAAAPVS